MKRKSPCGHVGSHYILVKSQKTYNFPKQVVFFEEKSPCGHVGSHSILVKSQKNIVFLLKVVFFEEKKAPAGMWVATACLYSAEYVTKLRLMFQKHDFPKKCSKSPKLKKKYQNEMLYSGMS